MSNRTDFVAGFILGGLLGTALALLFAPRSGEETRQQLTSSAEQLRERARERADDLLDRVRTGAQDLSERGRAALDDGVGRLRDAVERGREAIEEKARERQGRGGDPTES
ncbi:MAG: YtxH domain-containing protein [Armatimonadota bacterium]|nr:YtxH domain-containing protein [Armatimonadota bacterium]MDR7423462.1 YtxH domain-containing protein [Armatimonadota bacterium]MDR7453733.1 YtxH domain-containing protein [Armatimonadota bacterium]MDR7456393.1 YtxH domain-containing protein [Armatimonadota bacterium]MDR7496689.1 YtxH domain-containing protein [Armatimonadota bacterium]